MRLHILGICGTFMSGIALIAKESGHEVTGSDMNVYPPMSTQLQQQGIHLYEGYDPKHIPNNVDCVIVGNVIKRGNKAMEHVLAAQLPFTSGPAWLYEHVLKNRWVLAVSGTHGKTTTTSMLAWILETAGLCPGFLIGGVPENFGISARLGTQPFFVIEADEYDSAFFDKRSKFMHYHPKTLILNNLEFDHADIFPNLEAIQQQFHYLIRTVPNNGLIIRNQADPHLSEVMARGVWTPQTTFGKDGDWTARLNKADGSEFTVFKNNIKQGEICWPLIGEHNVTNALAAIAAAYHAGVTVDQAVTALQTFKNVKRRLEIKGKAHHITIYDDFAHHPTAIATTLAGLRASVGKARIIAVLEFGSFTMRSGVHKTALQKALAQADMVVCKATETDWGLKEVLATFKQPTFLLDDVDAIVKQLVLELKPNDHVIVMSNSGFGGIHQKLLNAITQETCYET